MSSTLAERPSSSRPRSISRPGAGADHIARGTQGHRGQALAVENKVERVDQVGRRIHERAVKIEHNGAGRGHREIAIGPRSIMQVGDHRLPS